METVTISGVKPNQHFSEYYLTAEATVPRETTEQTSALNEENLNNNNKTYQVSLLVTFFYTFPFTFL